MEQKSDNQTKPETTWRWFNNKKFKVTILRVTNLSHYQSGVKSTNKPSDYCRQPKWKSCDCKERENFIRFLVHYVKSNIMFKKSKKKKERNTTWITRRIRPLNPTLLTFFYIFRSSRIPEALVSQPGQSKTNCHRKY